MWRRFVVSAVVIAVSGLLPLIAHGGSCAAMPCCHRTTTTVAATASCCAQPTCVREDEALRTATTRLADSNFTAAILTFAASPTVASPLHAQFSPVSPPPSTSQRLSVLSVLLI